MASLLYSPALGAVETVREIVWSPLLSGPLLVAVTAAPDAVRDAAASVAKRLSLPYPLVASLNIQHVKTTLSIFFALTLIRQLNRKLNVMASNSWRLLSSSGWNWPDEIAVVTGGSSGIGQNIVEKLVARGLRVAVLDVQDLPKALQGNPRIRFYRCDVTTSESVSAAAEAVRRELGHPSILINNAGITSPASILKMSESYLRKIFAVNCIAHWITTQEFLPRMIQVNKGHIVTVASIASFVALPTGVDYSATKAGALAFHEGLACELKHVYKAPNIMTSIIHPNFVNTPLLDDVADQLMRSGVRMLTSDDVAEQTVAQVMSKRGGQVIIPASVSIVSGIRGWPTWLQEVLRDVLGRSVVIS